MLDAYPVTLQMIRSLRSIVEEIKRHDSDLADQATRAANSVLLNINEGRKRRGKDQARFFSYASGSNSEVRACIDGAFAWGWISDGDDVKNAQALLDRLAAMLWRLSHAR
jgi:four helix bundle protein